jgi:hypothetical protein
MSRRGRAPGLACTAISALLAALGLGGCVTLPTSGQISNAARLGSSSGGQQVQGVQLVPVPPGDGWSPSDIVRGFLAATGASWSGSPASVAVAYDYLAPAYRKQWRPTWSATVIDAAPAVTEIHSPLRVNPGPSTTVVRLTTQHLERLTAVKYGAGSAVVRLHRHHFDFTLINIGGQWRIDSMPNGGRILLLTTPDFVRDYQPRDRYFFPAAAAGNVLVPDPVYVPQQAGVDGVAGGLVRSLLTDPPASSWLYQAAATAFPSGTKLIGVQVPGGVNAVVDLGGTALRASPAARQRMLAQLFFTLTTAPYGTPGGTQVRSVTLQLGHRSWSLGPGNVKGWLHGGPPSPLLYLPELGATGAPELNVLRAGATTQALVALPPGLGRGPFTAMAVSPANQAVRGRPGVPVLAGCRGKTIYLVPLTRGARPIARTVPSRCSSLSWDYNGNLWVAAGTAAFVLYVAPGTGEVSGPSEVFNVAGTSIPPSAIIQAIRVAPDGVRVAMIVHDKAGNQIVVGAARLTPAVSSFANSNVLVTVGSDITGPIDLSWWDPDHLLVLARPGHGGLELDEAPLNGGPATTLYTQLPAGIRALTASWPYQQVVLGTQGSAVKIAPNGPFRLEIRSGVPAYPG